MATKKGTEKDQVHVCPGTGRLGRRKGCECGGEVGSEWAEEMDTSPVPSGEGSA